MTLDQAIIDLIVASGCHRDDVSRDFSLIKEALGRGHKDKPKWYAEMAMKTDLSVYGDNDTHKARSKKTEQALKKVLELL